MSKDTNKCSNFRSMTTVFIKSERNHVRFSQVVHKLTQLMEWWSNKSVTELRATVKYVMKGSRLSWLMRDVEEHLSPNLLTSISKRNNCTYQLYICKLHVLLFFMKWLNSSSHIVNDYMMNLMNRVIVRLCFIVGLDVFCTVIQQDWEHILPSPWTANCKRC